MTKIGKIRADVRKKIQASLLNSLREVLPDAKIRALCKEELSDMRERVLVPIAMIWFWVGAALNREKSFAAEWQELWSPVAAAYPEVAGWRPQGTGVLTRARARITSAILRKLRAEVTRQAQVESHGLSRWFGRRVVLWDGSTFSMPDEPELCQFFGKPRNQHGEGPFPIARIVNLMDEASGAVLASAWDHHLVSEQELAWRTADALQAGDVVLSDRNFSGIRNMVRCQQRGVDFVMRKEVHLNIKNHPRRRIGPNEWLVTLSVPKDLRQAQPDLPEQITVRVIKRIMGHGKKRKELWLVTSFLDKYAYPADELVKLYLVRWDIESDFEEIKIDLHLEVLRSKTVAGAHKEIEAHLLAYNLVRILILRAALQEGVPLKRISFLEAVRSILKMSECMRAAPACQLLRIYRALLIEIAAAQNPLRPGRHEPRAIRRNRKPFPKLKMTRAEWRASNVAA